MGSVREAGMGRGGRMPLSHPPRERPRWVHVVSFVSDPCMSTFLNCPVEVRRIVYRQLETSDCISYDPPR